jgi:host factor-I protein
VTPECRILHEQLKNLPVASIVSVSNRIGRFRHGWQGEIGTMEQKPAQNIQDTFLNTARKDRTNITIYLLSGVKLTGRIRSFDKYSVILETNNQEQLIFKHAISTVVSNRAHSHASSAASAGETATAAAHETHPR